MKCKNCKREISENSLFCNWCGKKQINEKKSEIKIPTPRKLSSGKWFIQLRLNGQSIPITSNTEDECKAEAKAIKLGIIETTKKKEDLDISLDQAIQNYENAHSNVLSPSTIRGYETIRKNRFQGLMKKKLHQINKQVLDEAVNKEMESISNEKKKPGTTKTKKISAKTVHNAYGLIHATLNWYEINIEGVKLPQKIKPQKKYLQTDEILKLIDAASGDSCEIPIIMAAWLGMTRSEICGLKWENIDFERKTINIRNAMVPDKTNKNVLKKGAKNETRQRTLMLPDYILEKLKDYPKVDDVVFHMCPDTIRKHIHKICKIENITDSGVHGLRHANAAVMTKLNIADQYAMARNGWSSEYTFKQIYSYIFDAEAKEADNKMNDFFSQNIGRSVHHLENNPTD